jgi:HNH endonuclease
VLRHRQVMETHLGRKLATHETVHHKDGNRANNKLSNLELWSSRHGRGQRVEDKVEFCLSFLREYPDFLANLGYRIEISEESARPQKVYESINVLLM